MPYSPDEILSRTLWNSHMTRNMRYLSASAQSWARAMIERNREAITELRSIPPVLPAILD